MNIINLWPNLCRAYEIAKLGGHSITVVFDSEYQQAPEDYKSIKDFYSDVVFSSAGDIYVKIYKPSNYNVKAGETKKDIDARVNAAAKINTPTERNNITASDQLLKTAVERMDFSVGEIELIHKLSATIARAGLYKQVMIEHLAEAIQYRCYKSERGYINAEDSSVSFGPNIKISKLDIYSEDIKAAINYLNSLL